MLVSDWTVDYGHGPTACHVPHAWRQDVPVSWEGPAIYRVRCVVPSDKSVLRFHGASCAAAVFVEGRLQAQHIGIWDAFDVALSHFAGQEVAIEVRVTKNGGPNYPITDVSSGFLPYVFHTFGGLYREVEWVERRAVGPVNMQDRSDALPYLRGVLHWGWYPELGHPNPGIETIEHELNHLVDRGFNCVKFCLWVPPHRYLDAMRKRGMHAWMELPLWNPSRDEKVQTRLVQQVLRVAEQYRQHPNIVAWTCGCELGSAMSAETRSFLVEQVQAITGCHWVKDDSGSAEMYGGGLKEFGSFRDFHPYCDLPFYRPVLESLQNLGRDGVPILLGEFNDVDVHRDLPRIERESLYWASSDPDRNAQGVRWQYDLPTVLARSPFAKDSVRSDALRRSSLDKARFLRKHVQECVRSMGDTAGYVVTGIRDTPISSSGVLDDWGEPHLPAEAWSEWNGPDCLYLLPTRRPTWRVGGNRPAHLDFYTVWADEAFWRVGVHAEECGQHPLNWCLSQDGETRSEGERQLIATRCLHPTWAADVDVSGLAPGEYVLDVAWGRARNSWPVWIAERRQLPSMETHDPLHSLGFRSKSEDGVWVTSLWDEATREAHRSGRPVLWIGGLPASVPMPFWREAAYEIEGGALEGFWREGVWYRFLPVCGDSAFCPRLLQEITGWHNWVVLINRVDTRTYAENPVLLRVDSPYGRVVATTLRPGGGLGSQPGSLAENPAGVMLLESLVQHFD